MIQISTAKILWYHIYIIRIHDFKLVTKFSMYYVTAYQQCEHALYFWMLCKYIYIVIVKHGKDNRVSYICFSIIQDLELEAKFIMFYVTTVWKRDLFWILLVNTSTFDMRKKQKSYKACRMIMLMMWIQEKEKINDVFLLVMF